MSLTAESAALWSFAEQNRELDERSADKPGEAALADWIKTPSGMDRALRGLGTRMVDGYYYIGRSVFQSPNKRDFMHRLRHARNFWS